MGRLTSENRPQRGQFLPDFQTHSPAMGQKDGEKWTAAVDLQPTIPKSDRLLALPATKLPPLDGSHGKDERQIGEHLAVMAQQYQSGGQHHDTNYKIDS